MLRNKLLFANLFYYFSFFNKCKKYNTLINRIENLLLYIFILIIILIFINSVTIRDYSGLLIYLKKHTIFTLLPLSEM